MSKYLWGKGSIGNSTAKKATVCADVDVVIWVGEDGFCIAQCPALPGCITQGETEKDALSNIKEAIELCLQVRSRRQGATNE